MAPKSKRAGGEPASKRRKGDSVVQGKCDLVVSALESSSDLPTDVRQMLVDMVQVFPHHGGLLHVQSKYLDTLVSVVGDALSNIEKGVLQEISEAEAKSSGGDQEKVTREAAVSEAEKRLSELGEIVKKRKAELVEESQAHAQAQEALTAAQAAQVAGDAEVHAAAEKLEILKGALTESVEPLKDGSLDGANATKKAAELAKLLGQFNVDESMRTAIPTAFAKQPTVRGTFDEMVVQQVSQVVAQRIKELEALIENAASAKAERAAAVETAQASADASKDKQVEAAEGVRASQSEEKEAEGVLTTKRASLNDLWPEIKRSAETLDSAKSRLAALREGGIAGWRELSAPPPAAAEAPAEEAAEAAEGAPSAAAEPPAAEPAPGDGDAEAAGK